MEILQRQRDLRGVEASSVLRELLGLAEVVEQLAAGTIVQHEVEFLALEGKKRERKEGYGLKRVFETDDEGVVHAAEHATLGFGVLHLVFVLDHRLLEDFHRVDLLPVLATHLKHLAEAALADHFQNVEAFERNGGVVQLRVLVSVVRVITTWTTSIERVVIAQVGEIDFLNPAWRVLRNGDTIKKATLG